MYVYIYMYVIMYVSMYVCICVCLIQHLLGDSSLVNLWTALGLRPTVGRPFMYI